VGIQVRIWVRIWVYIWVRERLFVRARKAV